MLEQMTFLAFESAISSRESADGPTPCNSPDGHVIAPSGRQAHRVNPIRWRGKAKAIKTRVIFGPKSFASSASADLSASLANRLKTQLRTSGSMEYRQTWKAKVTPLGRSYWAHTASAHHRSGNGFTGWPSPAAQNGTGGVNPTADPSNHFTLQTAAALAGWPTPDCQNHRPANATRTLTAERKASGRKTPAGMSLHHAAALSGWATPKATDGKGKNTEAYLERKRASGHGCSDLVDQCHTALGTISTCSTAPTENRGVLNPAHSRWLMGYPAAWDDCAGTETPLFHNSRPIS